MNLEKVSSILSIFSAILLVSGFSYNLIYYNKFNINIAEYVDLGEALVLFLPVLPQLLLLSALLSLGFLLLNPKHIDDNDRIQSFYSHFFESNQVLNTKILLWTIIICFLLILIPLLFGFYQAATTLFLGILALYAPLYLHFIYKKTNFNKNIPLIIFVVAFGITSIYFLAEMRTQRVLFNKRKLPNIFIIKKDSSSISSNDTLRYIGKTSKYFFFYNASDKSTVLYPTEDILTIRYFDRH